MPHKKTWRQATPGPSGTQWSDDLFRKSSQHNEPPIPGPIQASDSQLPSHENNLTCKPEPEGAPMQSYEEPFACPATPHSFIIIDNTPIGTPRHQAPLIPTMRR
ncbi:hypothetical protein O181_059806 [Austropuccinia psidii MF-1]|uniref:Uncharacterized protein n=1 Tax=Austropuccinia psidii MF-1 TaxID=1389203 RepID=A0A9Q3HW05_9BASI|nr:hypothetical protein [Austropuccinia psidii MF-1]